MSRVYEKILFNERGITAVPYGTENNSVLAATAVKNLQSLGVTIDSTGFELLKTASKKDITDWYYDTQEMFLESSGGDHSYKPFYPNFPEEVMQKDDFELFIDQILHYAVGYRPVEQNEKENRESLEEHPLKVLATVRRNDEEEKKIADEIFRNYLSSKENLPEHKINTFFKPYMRENPEWNRINGLKIENRNNLCYLYACALDQKKSTDEFPKLVTNDYLRIAKALGARRSGEEIPLDTESCKVKSLTRPQRRFLLAGLEKQKNLEEDVARNKQQWKVFFKMAHCGEFNFKRVNSVAQKLRNNQTLETFYSRVEKAAADEDFAKVVKILSERPGEFIKNINRLLSMKPGENSNIQAFNIFIEACRKNFEKTRPEDLLNLMEYMESRRDPDYIPVHNVKGKLIIAEKEYPAIPSFIVDTVNDIAKESLVNQVSSGIKMDRVYIDPGMYKMALPHDMKESSDSMNSYSKGSKLPIEKEENGSAKNMRMFVWWTNNKDMGDYWDGVDIDLSATFLKKISNKEYKELGCIAYHSGDKHTFGCVHSGDITDGGPVDGEGACEYIDLDMESLKKNEVDFVQIYINCYSGTKFGGLTNCEFGWMERSELDKSRQFDIKAVQQHSKLLGEYMGLTSVFVDVKNDEVIWVDSPDMMARAASNSRDVLTSVPLLMQKYGKESRMSMGDLAERIARHNGCEIVERPEEADCIFSVNHMDNVSQDQRVITSKDQDVWLGEFMSPSIPEPAPAVEAEHDRAVEFGEDYIPEEDYDFDDDFEL